MKPLRISLIEFSPSTGLFHFAFQLGAALAERGHEVELITGSDPELASSRSNFRLVSILPTWHPGDRGEPRLLRRCRRIPRAGLHVAAWGVLARHLRASRPDVAQWASWRFAMDGMFAGLIARRRWTGISVDLCHEPAPLQEQRSGASPYRRGWLLDQGLTYGYQSMDTVLVLGPTARKDLLRLRPGIARCELIPHGDEQVLSGTRRPPAPSECPARVVMFGSLTAYKGIDTLLDAWPTVRRAVPDAELVIAGGVVGDLDAGALARRVAGLAGADLQPGYVAVGDVAPLVGSARVSVAPYRRSNASGAVRLAQTLGRPVVVTDVGDLAASVVHESSGLVIAPDNSEALAGAIVRLLRDGAMADRMGRAGYDQLMATASWPIVASEVERVYLEALGRRRISPASSPPSSPP